MFSDDRCREIVLRALSVGDEQAADEFCINTESISRAKRRFKKIAPGILENFNNLKKLKTNFTDKELRAMAKSAIGRPIDYQIGHYDFSGNDLKYLHITDTHRGHKVSDKKLLAGLLKLAQDEGCEFVIHTGDVSEGMSNRAGHVYELDHIGYQAQLDACCEDYRDCKIPIYAIDGNHDRWYVKSVGAFIVEEIANRLDNFHYLGSDFATLQAGGIDIGLWHGEDGNSYALSYRMQQVINSLTSEQLPQILHAGHTHKYVTCIVRDVIAVSGGGIIEQTNWMRGKRIEAHVGAVITELKIKNSKITRFKHEFVKP